MIPRPPKPLLPDDGDDSNNIKTFLDLKNKLENYLDENQRGGLTIFEEVRRQGINKLIKRGKGTETTITNDLDKKIVSDFIQFFDKFDVFKKSYKELDPENDIVKRIEQSFFLQWYISEDLMFLKIKEWGKDLQNKHLYRKLLSSLNGIVSSLFISIRK